ncbi:MAG: hypothetical protein ABWY07_14015 [Burkholderiales bacterium]
MCRRPFVRDIAIDADDAIMVATLRQRLKGQGYVGYRTDRAWLCD